MTETLRETERRQLPAPSPTGESTDETITFDRTVLLFAEDPATRPVEAAQADASARTLQITWRTLAMGTTLEDQRATLFGDQTRIESLRNAGYTREVVTLADGTDAELLHHPHTDEHVMAWWTPKGGAHMSAVGLTRATILEVAATVHGGSPTGVENAPQP